MSSPTPQYMIVVSSVAAFLQIFRFAIDLIIDASRQGKQSDTTTTPAAGTTNNDEKNDQEVGGTDSESDSPSLTAKSKLNTKCLSITSTIIQIQLVSYFITTCALTSTYQPENNSMIYNAAYNELPLGATAINIGFAILSNVFDLKKTKFQFGQQFFYIASTFLALVGCTFALILERPSTLDYITFACHLLYFIFSVVEVLLIRNHRNKNSTNFDKNNKSGPKKAHLGRGIIIILKPYFWPDSTSTSAFINRSRAIATWICVISSKSFNLIAPIYLGKASTALSRSEFDVCAQYAGIFALLQFCSALMKECQSLVYLKVAQAAFVQLGEVVFRHLHMLSLDWHLRKKLGEVIRSMDRGILACDTLMKYLFLWLLPAIMECIMVCVIFAIYFNYLPLALSIFLFVFVYMVWTICVTLWRKKFRKSVARTDNDWHDKCTDSLVNFETVKYFTAEKYEVERFSESVKQFQNSSVHVQASLSFLNITQMILLQACLATSLILAAYGIKKRTDCCIANGCLDWNSLCCSDMASLCGGMELGDFVAVLSYTINLFGPLNFLGSVYNAIVMAMIDLRNLSELLAEEADVTDAPDAIDLPEYNEMDSDIAVEFDNVFFHYPSQPETTGLKGVSFKMKKGTTTAIVGTTGAGKTTISRLFFRFYDVISGAVKVNGVDVRALKQSSLRSSIGVVPQTTTLFNDTLKENVLYGKRDANDGELSAVAEAAQISKFIESLPDGWDTVVGDRGLKLSGGEKQRTAIARCLLKDPPFVMLDEATSSLDTCTENAIQEALNALGSDRTCLVIAHRLGTIRNADNIVVLGDGCVLEQGTHDELMARENSKYAEMWNMQLHSSTSTTSLSNLT